MSYISNSSARLVLQLSIKYFFFSKTQENRASLYLEEKEGGDPKYNTPPPQKNVKITYALVETKRRPKLDYLQATELSIKYFTKPPIQSNFC